MILPTSIRIQGHAIVTADGMIADASGAMPAALRNEADWRHFQAALDDAALVVLGRLGHEHHPNPGRRRLVLTSGVTGLVQAPNDPLTSLWNPAGASIGEVLRKLGIAAGVVAVTGGTAVFDQFSGLCDSFVLSEVHDLVLPSGRPCFSTGHPRVVLAANGLRPDAAEPIDAGVTLTPWRRA
jgi:hypothetical protein